MIKFLDIKKINDRDSIEIKNAINRVVDSGWYILGKEVEQFESKFAEYHKAKHVIATSNGLDALKLILKAYIELGVFVENDEIIVPANTFIASVLAISDAKLKPILVDVSEKDFLIDTSKIEEKISDKTKGIMNVHLYGNISCSPALLEIIKVNKLIHIEDSAQAIGSIYQNEKSGTIGDAGAVSFYPGKNLGALGDAGAIITNNDLLAQKCRALGNYGSEEKYIHQFKGFNCRMDEIQAAVLSVKLEKIDLDNTRRQAIAETYCSQINNPKIQLPLIPKNSKSHVWHLFVVRVKQRALFQDYLSKSGVQSLIHYPTPIHRQASYQAEISDKFPVTELLSEEILSIPISPVMSDDDVEKIITVINQY